MTQWKGIQQLAELIATSDTQSFLPKIMLILYMESCHDIMTMPPIEIDIKFNPS